YQPDSARLHFLLGLAYHHDPAGDHDRALAHYRRALRLSPRHVRCLGEAGLLAVHLGRVEFGLKLLRRAVRLVPGDANAVRRLTEGLQLAGQPEEALPAVRHALFVQPRCTTLRRLWMSLQIDGIRRSQCNEQAAEAGEGPRILPFLRPVGGPEPTT